MPTYTFRKKSGPAAEFTEVMTIAEMEIFETDNPEWEAACGAPILGYNCYSLKKPDWLKDKLRAIKENNPGSPMKI